MVRQAISITMVGGSWSGSVLLDPSFTADTSTVYLRSLQLLQVAQAFFIQFSPAADTPSGGTSDAEIRTEWETGGAAIQFVAGNGDTLSLAGPAHSSVGFPDATEPYGWVPNNGSALAGFVASHGSETVTLYLESGFDPTEPSEWSDLAASPSIDGEWSEPAGLLLTDSEWSDLFGLVTAHSEWSTLFSSVTTHSEWSDLAAPPSTSSDWSDVSGGTGRTGVEFLATPDAPIGLMLVDQYAGSYTADISWAGQANHVYLDQARTRWIARVDGLNAPAPNKADADAWAESTGRVVVGDFQYVDTISRNPSPVLLGPALLRDQMLTDLNFVGITLWAMARLEVDDQLKDSLPAPGTFSPFYVLAQRDTSQTALTLFRGSDDDWCVGQMALQPNQSWEVIVTVAGVQGLHAIPFQYNVADESITLVLTTIVAQFGFILHAVNFLSDGSILLRRGWGSPPELPAGLFGPFVITNTDTTLIVDPILHCP